MKIPLNSIFSLEWSPRVLIEASAGTGKTYTITGLFVRLLIEKELDIDQVLVMTFTKKATSELRDRIFKLLRESLLLFEEGKTGHKDAFLNDLAGRGYDRNDAVKRLRNAIQNFDESQVTTIHGFCQKVLTEESLLAGTPFEIEVTRHDELLARAAKDFWRLFMDRHSQTEAGKYTITKLLEIAKTPAELRDKLSSFFSKPYAVREGEVLDDPVTYLSEVIRTKNQMADLWRSEKNEIVTDLLDSDLKGYTENSMKSRIRDLSQFLEDTSYSSDTCDKLKYFISSHVFDHQNLKNKKTKLPSHSFFEICENYDQLTQQINKVKTTIISQAADEIIAFRNKISNTTSAVTYDDLLIKVKEALTHPEGGEKLAQKLLKKYPYALVDEFQDTDPVQYEIVDRVYPRRGNDSGLFMIGDPKQAIYGFRGADVYTYFGARDEITGTQYTLNKNFRSTPRMIEAVNTIFSGDNTPFIDNEISFFRSESGIPESGDEFCLDGKPADHISISVKEGNERNQGACKDFAFRQTVNEIAELLDRAEEGRATIKGEKIRAGDIAVLVSSNKDADEIKRILKTIGVDSVTYTRQHIFDTFEARRMELVMAAILDPFHRTNLNNALFSGFFGLNLNRLFELREIEGLREKIIEELQELNETWHKKGFYPMFRKLLSANGRLAGLATLTDSERVLTNLHHLADICTKTEKEGEFDPHSLFSWFVKEKADPDKDDEKNLLLESDRNLVKISTIHNSKGLQFPVVFCPTLWMGRGRKSGKKEDLLFEYHREPDRKPVLNFDQYERENAITKSRFESVAEEVRKMYVALTRAKYYCSVMWCSHTESVFSGLGSLFIGGQSIKEIIKTNKKEVNDQIIDDQYFVAAFRNLEEKSPGTIRVQVLEEAEPGTGKVKWRRDQEQQLTFTSYNGPAELRVQNKTESFSSLVHHKSDPFQPDHDQVLEAYTGALSDPLDGIKEKTIFNFPRGATAGTAIHKLFEHDSFDFSTSLKDDHSGMIEEVLEHHRIDVKWAGVVQKMIRNVCSAKTADVELYSVLKKDQLREMEFHFPVSDPVLDRLLQIIRNGKNTGINISQMRSSLTGFIDLIIRQNGRYYILDYKSNYLGDSLSDYEFGRLEQEMQAASYDLQYHLYTVALKKYLEKRLPDFDYESQFGGVAYLFVRGMRAGSENGVWFHKPELPVITHLEQELGGGYE